jgi:hypothetical protein
MALLFGAEVVHLIANSIRLAVLLESRTDSAHQVAGWLDLFSNLPLLAAAAFGFLAFSAGGRERIWWLRRAFLLAALGVAISFASSVLEYGALESSPPEGMNLALLASCAATFALTAGFYSAASAVRDGSLRRASLVLGVAQLFIGLSSWAYTLAYSDYPHYGAFTRGLAIEGFGAFAAGLSLLYAASAFRGAVEEGEEWILERERRLFAAAGALGLSFLLISLGEAQRAAVLTTLGYLASSAVAGWLFALVHLLAAAAFFCAARGFRAEAARPA